MTIFLLHNLQDYLFHLSLQQGTTIGPVIVQEYMGKYLDISIWGIRVEEICFGYVVPHPELSHMIHFCVCVPMGHGSVYHGFLLYSLTVARLRLK